MSSIEPPQWVRALVSMHGGCDLQLIMTKSLTKSDLDFRHQNRLPIPPQYADDNLFPMLTENERITASLLHPRARRNLPGTSRVQGRNHGGQEVCVYSRSGFWFKLMLTRWDSTNSTVIKGPEYKKLLTWSSLKENDVVELWGFREGEERKLCFALGKKAQ